MLACVHAPSCLEGKFCELGVETVRKVPNIPETWPSEAPQRHRTARFGPRKPAKPALGALPEPLFGQFLYGVQRSSPVGHFPKLRQGFIGNSSPPVIHSSAVVVSATVGRDIVGKEGDQEISSWCESLALVGKARHTLVKHTSRPPDHSLQEELPYGTRTRGI